MYITTSATVTKIEKSFSLLTPTKCKNISTRPVSSSSQIGTRKSPTGIKVVLQESVTEQVEDSEMINMKGKDVKYTVSITVCFTEFRIPTAELSPCGSVKYPSEGVAWFLWPGYILTGNGTDVDGIKPQ